MSADFVHVVVVSAFRNSPKAQVDRWLSQIARLKTLLGHTYYVSGVAVWGDCKPRDKTVQMLMDGAADWNLEVDIVEQNHGGPFYGSVDVPERMQQLSVVANAAFDSVIPADDVVIYVESDLIWTPQTMQRLVGLAQQSSVIGFDIFTPMIFAGEHFYDVWAFREGGTQFGPYPPYHSSLESFNGPIKELDSAGSCLVMRGEIARDEEIRMEKNALVEWCNKARAKGYKIGAVLELRIDHPV